MAPPTVNAVGGPHRRTEETISDGHSPSRHVPPHGHPDVTEGGVMPGAASLIATVLDTGTFVGWDAPPPPVADDDYRTALAAAARRSGADEAIVTGQGRIAGRAVAVVCSEYGFLGGSIGATAAGRIVAAVERATAARLPLLASAASGGTRMQEGTPAFVRMAPIVAAVTAHKAAGLPYLVHLRHPTTGGVLASWGSLGHVTVAEPGALIGFLGPTVYEALHGRPFPAGVQTAEALHDHGLVDAVLPTSLLRGIAARALALLAPQPPATDAATPAPTPRGPVPEPPAWESVRRTRHPGRPGLHAVLRQAEDALPLSGTGAGERGEALVLALVRFGGTACVLAGHDRTVSRPPTPADLRTARRGMRLAGELGLPFVTVIDTAGAELSPAAEWGGLAGEIARCLADLQQLPAPTLSVLLGQGTGGAAIALLPADRVVAARHAWLGPLPPEGAATIRFGDPRRAPEITEAQHVRATDLLDAGVVDRVLDELPDAADEPEAFARRVADVIAEELRRLGSGDTALRSAERVARGHRLVALPPA
ncbi:carboxyl transferase domain-containing protein [Pseudonocardia sulfidoxydans]|uniref:carboxyl transferase domain-containing protein n=1 Tax=Pseudonocardia sulfidoxydans TaxID=54011 RepID=UPI001FEA15DD|nr:carboxyl transferase domain-containing protein [Pseudonocardia sulfidoxydans]